MVRSSLSRRLKVLRPSLLGVLTVLLVCVPARRGDLSGGVHVTLADLASVALIGVAAFTLLVKRKRRFLPGRVWLLVPIALAAVLATFTATDLMGSMPGLLRFLQIFVLIPLALLVVVRTTTDAWLLVGAVAVSALVQGTVGVWQAATGTGASYAGEYIRAVGTFGAQDVMAMATIVGYGWIILLGTGLATRGRARMVCLAGVAALSLPLALSLSRGTWVATLCAALVMLLLYGLRTALRTGLFVTAAAVVLVLGLGVGSDTFEERVTSITSSVSQPDQSVDDRYSLWRTATAIWQDHPVTGVGPRGFAVHRDSYAPLELSSGSDIEDPVSGYQRQPLLSPHNMYLLVLSEQGLPGLVSFVLLLAALGVWSVKRLRRAKSEGGKAFGMVVTGFLTWQVANFSYADIGGPPTLVMSVMLGMALWWAQ